MNTSPPAVAIEPPMFGAPVLSMPRVSRLSFTPSGTVHRNSPVARSIACSFPHGGRWHGRSLSSQKRAYEPPGAQRSHPGAAAPAARRRIMPIAPISFTLTNAVAVVGSIDAPDHVAPPSVPGNHRTSAVSDGVYAPPLTANCANSFEQKARDSGVTSVRSAAPIAVWRDSGAGFSG